MVKKILIGSLLSAMFLLSGCGDSEGEDRLAIQQMLDDGNYAGVISALESSADSNDDYIALGAAYMGKAGVSLADIVSAVASGSDDERDSSFAAYVDRIAANSTPTALVDLGKSNDYYKMVVQGACVSNLIVLSDSQKDICLYIGLGTTTKAAVAIDSLVGDISTFGDDTSSDDKLTASTCAMQYAFDRTNTCGIVESTDVNFTNRIYTPLVGTVNSVDYYFLMTGSNQTVLTQGYCAENNFSTRVNDYNSTTAPFACPINEDPEADDLTTADVLVNILNEGMDSIGAATTEDIQADIDEFKCEIFEGTYNEFSGCSEDITQDIAEQDIIDYLNSQN